MKAVGRVLEKGFVDDEMQFGFMSERGTIYAVFIMRWMQEEYHAKGKKVVYVFCEPRENS